MYDTVLPIDSPLKENEKRRAVNGFSCMGGPAANAAYLCGLWHADTYLCARIGKDAAGQAILDTLTKVGVHTETMLVDEQTKTSTSSILVNLQNGSRTIVNIPLSEAHVLPVTWPEHVDVILMDGHELPLCREAMQRYPNAQIVWDGDRVKPHSMDLLKRVDHLICSEEFASQITGHETDETTYAQLQPLARHVILTVGEKGWINNGRLHPAYQAKTLDTTGAGDVFHGAFAYGLDQRMSVPESLELAGLAAAISTEKAGGMPSIPTLEDVKQRRP